MSAAEKNDARRRPPAGWEWALIAVSIAAGAYAIGGPSLRRSPAPEVVSMLSVEADPRRGPSARIDDAALRAVCLDLGLPDPPTLDGADPVPVRRLLEQIEAWARTGDRVALADLGRLYQAIEEHQSALACFGALVAADPTNAEWQYALGSEAQALGLDTLAVSALEEARRLDPSYPTTHARLGQLHLVQGDLDRAAESFERYRALRPSESLGYVGLGRVALRRDDVVVAEEVLRRAVDVTPNDYLAHRLLSRALALGGKTAEARTASAMSERYPRYEGWLVFDERLQAAHAFGDTRRYLENQMRVASGAGNTKRLIEHAQQLLARRPDDTNTMGLLAVAYLEQRQRAEARAMIDRALALQPESVKLLCVRAQIALLEGEPATARAVVARALEINPSFATAFDLDGRILLRQGRFAESIWCLRQALALAPEADGTRVALAQALQGASRPQQAAAMLQEVLARDPGHAEARRRLDALTGG